MFFTSFLVFLYYNLRLGFSHWPEFKRNVSEQFEARYCTVELMDSYIKAYENEFAGVVLSAVRTEAMQHLADVTYSYVIKYFNVDRRREYADVFAYLPGGKYTGTTTYPSYYDINAIMSKYLTADEYAHWREAYDMAVPYTAASPKWYSALRGRAIIYDQTFWRLGDPLLPDAAAACCRCS